jgi:hypothetical protein
MDVHFQYNTGKGEVRHGRKLRQSCDNDVASEAAQKAP